MNLPDLYQPLLCPAPAPRPAVTNFSGSLLVRVPNWLGDGIMAMPALERLREKVPGDCRIAVLCRDFQEPLWNAAPWADRVFAFSGRRARGPELRRDLAEFQPGAALVLPNSFGSALDVWGHGIPVRVGRAGRFRRLLLTHCLPAWKAALQAPGYHHANHYFELVEKLAPIDRHLRLQPLRLPAGGQAPEWRQANPAGSDNRWLAIAPGAAYGPAKRWPLEYFRKVAEWWQRGGHGRVVVLGQAGPDRRAGELIAGHLPGALNLAGKTDLGQLLQVLDGCRLAICNDSGTMHLAAALGKGGVAIFGSTDPVATGPVAGRWLVLKSNLDCAPCFARTCRRPAADYACLHQITPELACAALEHLDK